MYKVIKEFVLVSWGSCACYLSKGLRLLRKALLIKKKKKTNFLLNVLEHRVQGILKCAQANLWAEVLKRLVLGPVLAGNKNKNTKTKAPGWIK